MSKKQTRETTVYEGKPLPFNTEEAARSFAAGHLSNQRLSIIYSPNKSNAWGDFFIDEPAPLIRSWENILYVGLGSEALKKTTRKKFQNPAAVLDGLQGTLQQIQMSRMHNPSVREFANQILTHLDEYDVKAS